uniref:Uncharacterized protein n=1 Tax=Anguilla anguilla TaxID=7936 RepID=A0A0E9WFL2_ANGAN
MWMKRRMCRQLFQPEHQMDINPPKWSEVEQAVKRARASSAPGPNGVPY